MNRFLKRALTVALGSIALSSALPSLVQAQDPNASDAAPNRVMPPPPRTLSNDQLFYEVGVLLSHNLDAFALSDAEFAKVKDGLNDGFHHKADVKDAQAAMSQIQGLIKERQQKVADANQKTGEAYLTKAAAQPGAKKTASGLVYISVKEGTGKSPVRTDKVKVTYEGRLTDGTVFDSSAQHGGTADFPLSGVIACWTEALQLMKVGGKAKIVCPASIAYGQRQVGPSIKPGSTLEFDIELLEIEPPPPPPAAAGASSGGAVPAKK